MTQLYLFPPQTAQFVLLIYTHLTSKHVFLHTTILFTMFVSVAITAAHSSRVVLTAQFVNLTAAISLVLVLYISHLNPFSVLVFHQVTVTLCHCLASTPKMSQSLIVATQQRHFVSHVTTVHTSHLCHGRPTVTVFTLAPNTANSCSRTFQQVLFSSNPSFFTTPHIQLSPSLFQTLSFLYVRTKHSLFFTNNSFYVLFYFVVSTFHKNCFYCFRVYAIIIYR